MSTGALLSHRGMNIVLLESRGSLGGRASSRERDGFVIDYGVHGHRFGEKGAASRVYRSLGKTLELVKPRSAVVLHRGDLCPVDISPAGIASMKLLSPREKLEFGLALLRLAVRRPADVYDRSIEDVCSRRLGDEARAMLSTTSGIGLISADLADTSAGEFSWFLRAAARSLRGGPMAFPRGGCREHTRTLSGFIRRTGEVRTGFKVNRVLVRNGAVSGVEGEQGVVEARAAVLALPLRQSAGMLPAEGVATRLTERMKRIRPAAGISWEVALRRPVCDVDLAASTEPMVLGCFSSNIDPEVCPRGKQLSYWFMPVTADMFDMPGFIERAERELRVLVTEMFPRLEDSIEWERMIRMPVVEGAAPLVSQPWPSRPGPAGSGIPGLFFAGDTVGVPGQSGDIAFESALRCAQAVASYL